MKWFHRTETLETRLFKSIVSGNKEQVRTILGERPDRNLTFYVVDCKNTVGLLSPSEIEAFHKGIRDTFRYDGAYATFHQRTPTELTDKLLHMTENTVYKDILEDLIAFGYPPPYEYLGKDLVKAVRSNDVTAVEALLTKKADVNHVGSAEEYPINIAVKNGNLPIVKLLVENGASKEARTWAFKKAVWVEYDSYQCFDDITGYEKTISLGFYTPLMLAIEQKNSEIAKYLIENGPT